MIAVAEQAIAERAIAVSKHVNSLGQPIGAPLPNWVPPPFPPKEPIEGRFCRLEPVNLERHAQSLYSAFSADSEGRLWTYLPYGPFGSFSEFESWMQERCFGEDPLFFAICSHAERQPLGLASYLRITPRSGSIEVGHLLFSPMLQRTVIATEAMYLMMKRAFELGYRRYEWKCDALNANSRAAAERLGLSFEGIFRQATVYKGRTRDTAWFAAIDSEWPLLRETFGCWLDPSNFHADGMQRHSLTALRQMRANRSGRDTGRA